MALGICAQQNHLPFQNPLLWGFPSCLLLHQGWAAGRDTAHRVAAYRDALAPQKPFLTLRATVIEKRDSAEGFSDAGSGNTWEAGPRRALESQIKTSVSPVVRPHLITKHPSQQTNRKPVQMKIPMHSLRAGSPHMLSPLDWQKGLLVLLSLPLSMDTDSVALSARE